MMRLDEFLLSAYPRYSRTQIQRFIKKGEVLVNGQPLLKPGAGVRITDRVVLTAQAPRYVSRAGYKLEKALIYFSLTLAGKSVLDVGISTGGFTDCLLQHGAQKVIGIDVGYGQLHPQLKNDPRLLLFEHTHINSVTPALLGELVDMITVDVSFISLRAILDTLLSLLKTSGELVLLIKPQFETQGEHLSKKGIIKDSHVHDKVIATLTQACVSQGLIFGGCTESPLLGGSGNKEFLAYFKKRA